VQKIAFGTAAVIVIAVTLIQRIRLDLAGSWFMLLLLLAVVLGYFGVRENE
jgi:hypothetical protein